MKHKACQEVVCDQWKPYLKSCRTFIAVRFNKDVCCYGVYLVSVSNFDMIMYNQKTILCLIMPFIIYNRVCGLAMVLAINDKDCTYLSYMNRKGMTVRH